MISNFLQIITNAYIIFFKVKLNQTSASTSNFILLVGLQCFLQWFTILKLTRYYDKIYLMTNVVFRATPKVIYAVIGFVPLFVGYALLGHSQFYQTDDFATFTKSLYTLFFVIFQDGVIAHIYMVANISTPEIAIVYYGSFLLIMVLSFINILVSIFQEELSQREQIMLEEKELFNQLEP